MKTNKINWDKLGAIVSVYVTGVSPCGETIGHVKKAIVELVANYTKGEVLYCRVLSEKNSNGDDALEGSAFISLRKAQAKELVERSKIDGGVLSLAMESEVRFFVADRQMVAV